MIRLSRRAMLALTAAVTASPLAAQSVPEVKDYMLGNPDAPVKMVEYASYTCPHCANFHADSFANLKRDYIDTGKVHFTLREVYFDRYGLWAAMVARCGGDLRYFGIHDMLYEQQSEWSASDDPTVVIGNLRTIGLSAGLTNEALDLCLNDAAMADAMVKRFEANMDADGVRGTPTFFIDDEMYSNMTWEDLRSILDEALAG